MKLSINNLSKKYSSHLVLDKVDFEVRTGVNYLLAPNGSGKSTLLKIIADMEFKDSGSILFNGKQAKFSHYGSYVPDKMTMYPFITGEHFLALVASAKKVSKHSEAIDRLIDELNLRQYMSTEFSVMSLGTQKKFFILAGLIGKYSCLIMDEPSNGVDKKSLSHIVDYLKVLSVRKTILIATHDNDLLTSLPGNIIYLQNNALASVI